MQTDSLATTLARIRAALHTVAIDNGAVQLRDCGELAEQVNLLVVDHERLCREQRVYKAPMVAAIIAALPENVATIEATQVDATATRVVGSSSFDGLSLESSTYSCADCGEVVDVLTKRGHAPRCPNYVPGHLEPLS